MYILMEKHRTLIKVYNCGTTLVQNDDNSSQLLPTGPLNKEPLECTDPEPLDALDLVPPHHSSSEELRLLDGHRLARHLPVWVQQLLGVVPHRLRQPVLDVFVGVAHLLDVLGFQLLRGGLLTLVGQVYIRMTSNIQKESSTYLFICSEGRRQHYRFLHFGFLGLGHYFLVEEKQCEPQ